MHLRVRPLQVLIKLLFLVVAQELADLFVGFIAVRPHLVQALFTRQTFVLHDLLRGIMQFLEDWCDSGLLIAGEIKLLGQNFQLLLGGRHAATPALRVAAGSGLLRDYRKRDHQHEHGPDCKQANAIHRRSPFISTNDSAVNVDLSYYSQCSGEMPLSRGRSRVAEQRGGRCPKMSAPNCRKMLGKGNNKKSSGGSRINASGVRVSGSAV